MTATESELNFEHAAYVGDAAASSQCGNCKENLSRQYWKWQEHAICETCSTNLNSAIAKAQSSSALWKAILVGGAAALACGIAYAVFVAVTDFQFALITIGIAIVIAKVVRKASLGFGGRRFQILAVVLTYVASAMGYAPAIWSGLSDSSNDKAPVASEHKSTEPGAKPENATKKPAAADTPSKAEGGASLSGMLVAVAFLFAFTLAAPFLVVTEAPIGLLIVFVGLWQAWKLSAAVQLGIEGPFQIPARDAEAPAA